MLYKKWKGTLDLITNVFDIVALKLIQFRWHGKESVSNMLCITSSGISAHPKGAQLVIFGV